MENLLSNLMQAYQSLGTGTPETAAATQQAGNADTQLNNAGSVMGSEKAGPRADQASQGPLGATISQMLEAANPINWMGGPAGVAASAPGIIPRAMKTMTPAIEMDLPAVLKAIAGGSESAPSRSWMQPALQNLKTGEVIKGSIGSGHGPLYEAIPPSWQHSSTHGFVYPNGPFMTQSLIDTLQQPTAAQQIAVKLAKGHLLNDILASIKLR